MNYHNHGGFFIYYGMKKLLFLFAAVMTVATVWVFCACSANGMSRVSERRGGYFTAANDAMTVTAVSGVRETPYETDGVVGALKPYTLITVVPAKFDVDAVYTYSATIGQATYGGTLIVHPFAASFSAELDIEAAESFTVTVMRGVDKTELVLDSLVTADMLAYDKAIDAAKTELKPRGDYEIRARIIKNPLGDDGLCWHVAFYSADGQCGVLLDPTNAKILAKKTD